MTNVFLSLLIAASAGTWIFSKLMRSTGNNTKSALSGAAISGVLIFIAAMLISSTLI